ncbi:hypothetical protein BN946_scf184970.g71 [Trametes cinnabarina]|uniref:C2H2-type domain-containing protein n=1 Tax=Pycnoporus cinnabarinus TaxID=5643 RepID=A0A060SJ22_PYCCI|nr:hypothetical protein BN946_scf184970.g71 [Trametes cinnabarina]
MSVVCKGCGQSYTDSGFLRHLSETTRPPCIAVWRELRTYRSPSPSDSSSEDEDENNENKPEPPPNEPEPPPNEPELPPNDPGLPMPEPFEGDYFGDYVAGDFDDYDEVQGAPEDHQHQGGEGDSDSDDSSDNDDNIADQHSPSDSEESDEEDAANYEDGDGWEAPLHASGPAGTQVDVDDEAEPEDEERGASHTEPAPHCLVKCVYGSALEGSNTNVYAPFLSALDWGVARWAKMRGPGSTAVTELLDIPELVEKLGLSFKNANELNAIIDKKVPAGRPRFIRREVVIAGEAFEIFYRDIIAWIRALFGDPEFAGILVFTPERHYADADETIRVYFDMHTGRWWWDTQRALDQLKPGATIIPIIISSDKTQLTLFGSKTAYPVYMTIGNLPKDVRRKPSRRGQILLAYLPSTRLQHITSHASRRRALANLYHACLTYILRPLKHAGINGIALVSGDGVSRRGHPIFALHVGDYLEQLLAAGCKHGECPKCPIPRDEIGILSPERPFRDLDKVLAALRKVSQGPRAYTRACKEAGIKPIIRPYWADLPFVNIYRLIVPDLLHQLYQGVIKHLVGWLSKAYGPDELDARCRRFPPNHNIRLFMAGITKLQRVTGKEHAQMCRFLVGLILGARLPDGLSPVRLIRAVCALLDFVYLAQYPAHSSETLELLKRALVRFHQNKAIFVDLGIRGHFKLPKLHWLEHYVLAIILFGTTDNYDTQYTERLHIDFAKEAYRATNHKDEFPQMTLWLERREKILRHEVYIHWRLECVSQSHSSDREHDLYAVSASSPHPEHLSSSHGHPVRISRNGRHQARDDAAACAPQLRPRTTAHLTRIKIARHPSVKALTFARASQAYGATELQSALAHFAVQYREPHLPPAEVKRRAAALYLRFNTVAAFHRMKFLLDNAQELGVMEDTKDAAHARPQRHDKHGRLVPGRFDTVLINEHGEGGTAGIQGYRVGRIRLIFKLPKQASQYLFPGMPPPGYLAYVEWFSAFTQPHPVHNLYKVTRPRGRQGEKPPSVVEISSIRRSCHLFPDFGPVVPRDWTSSTVLDRCEHFWTNPFTDLHMYMSMF